MGNVSAVTVRQFVRVWMRRIPIVRFTFDKM
jgi:hypothetical protein